MGSLRPNMGRADRVGPGRRPVQSLSPAMAPRGAGAARILSLVLVLAAVALVSWAREPRGALWPGQGCAALGRCCPGRDPTCAARGPPLCFCDQACGAVRDCCADYARACPGEPPGARGAGRRLEQRRAEMWVWGGGRKDAAHGGGSGSGGAPAGGMRAPRIGGGE